MSLPISRRGLYWFHNDFRLTDNPLLQAAAEQVDEMLCVCSPPQMTHFLSRFSQQCQLGASREAFWSQSASDLAASLAKLGQSLYCLPDLSAASLAALIREQGITHLYCQRFAGIDEQRIVDALQATCPDLNIIQRESGHILDESELPFSLAELPATFSRFRKRVEPLAVPGPLPAVETLPSVIEVDYPLVTTSPCQSEQFLGERARRWPIVTITFRRPTRVTIKRPAMALTAWLTRPSSHRGSLKVVSVHGPFWPNWRSMSRLMDPTSQPIGLRLSYCGVITSTGMQDCIVSVYSLFEVSQIKRCSRRFTRSALQRG